MKISSSIVGMESARSYQTVTIATGRFELKDYSGAKTDNSEETVQEKESKTKEKLNTDGTDNEETSPLMQLQEKMAAIRKDFQLRTSESLTAETIRQKTILYIFDLLFGRTNARRYSDWENENYKNCQPVQTIQMPQTENLQPVNFQSAQINMVYSEQCIYSESEETSFSTTGTVKTADGRELSFNVDVTMSRSFTQTFERQIASGVTKFCDPLVISLDDSPLTVSDQKIKFDIDGDGEVDIINKLGRGNGYLAIDRNKDGAINDGSELFGTKTGNGFEELALFDQDGNGWIDENDSVWDDLKIWAEDENGNDKLYTLAEAGVGAICLQNVSTDFHIKDEDNRNQALIRQSGVFLYENGAAGTMRQVDMAKYRREA